LFKKKGERGFSSTLYYLVVLRAGKREGEKGKKKGEGCRLLRGLASSLSSELEHRRLKKGGRKRRGRAVEEGGKKEKNRSDDRLAGLLGLSGHTRKGKKKREGGARKGERKADARSVFFPSRSAGPERGGKGEGRGKKKNLARRKKEIRRCERLLFLSVGGRGGRGKKEKERGGERRGRGARTSAVILPPFSEITTAQKKKKRGGGERES